MTALPAGNGRLGEAEYAELVARVRAAVAASVPPGASVLVLSKGDEALVAIPGVAAAHFPQDGAGGYAGYHPRDGAEAVAQLQRLGRGGAEYLVIPVTGRWWLEFYAGFADFLAGHCELVADVGDACLVYRLGSGAPSALGDVAYARPQGSMEQIRDYLENLLSTDTHIAVLETGQQLAGALAPVPAASLSSRELEAGDDRLPALTHLAARGIGYLVVPRAADQWLDAHPQLAAGIEGRCRKLADQRHLCRVYELGGVRAR
jgi:hypothetical protein